MVREDNAGQGRSKERFDAPQVQLSGITVRFPGVLALDGVDLTLRAGEVHALTGENGSGKSTLARVIGGSVQPLSGTILFDGRETAIADPRRALDLGIVSISQELTLAHTLTVAENIFLGRLPKRRGRVDWRALRVASRDVIERVGAHIDVTAVVQDLSVELQQEVEIARAISHDARVLVLDEATSSLSEAATRRLLEVVEEQRVKGVAVLMISHRMPEVYAAASIATVLRDGRRVGTVPLPQTPESRLVSMMVGRELGDYYGKREIEQGETIIEVSGLESLDGVLAKTSFQVRRGEILGVAGLVGSGKAELGLALGGAVACRGSVKVAGRPVTLGDPRQAVLGGIGFVPDDRKRSALLPTRSVTENFTLAWNRLIATRLGILRTAEERRMVADAIKRYGVVTASPGSVIATLSGGNQQKVILGRTFALNVDVLVLSEPTRGIDVGAKSDIYRLMQMAAEQGAGIILISSELPELLGIADRIIVFYGGEVRGEFGRGVQEGEIAHVAVTGMATQDHAPQPAGR